MRTRQPHESGSATARRGFTLVELAVGLAIISIIMVAIGSVVVVAAKALPAAPGPTETTVSSNAATDRIASELRYATSITESTPTSVAFTVADRNGDGIPETIRYAWSGTPGAPLTREYNGAAPVTQIPSVQGLSLGYIKHKHTTNTSSSTTWDSGEVLLSTFSSWAGILASSKTTNLTSTTWVAEKFTIDQVTLPSDITRLAITRVTLTLKKPMSGTIGAKIGIYLPSSAGSSTPAASPIGTAYTMPAASLTTSWALVDSTFSDVVFNNGSNLNFIIVVKGVASTTSASIQYLNSALAPLGNSIYRYSLNSGASWQPGTLLNTNDAVYAVYGSYQRQVQSSSSVNTYTLGSVTISLRSAASVSTRIDTAVEVLNEPSIAGP